MTERTVEVWILYSAPNRQSVASAITQVRASCDLMHWEVREIPVKPIRINGRPFGEMKSEDAVNLYKSIHRAKVGIWQVGRAHAPAKPQPDDKIKDYIRLETFVRYKAFHRMVQAADFFDLWNLSMEDFQTWLTGAHCENEGDPRCLPLHLFRTKADFEGLGTQKARTDFAVSYGNQSARKDADGLLWNRPRGGLHGRDGLHVAGRELAIGFHWDVTAGRNGGKIVSPEGVWSLDANHYANIYPDAHVRAGQGASRRKLRKQKAR